MTFFYDLNKKLNTIRELPETTHQQLNEGDYSAKKAAAGKDIGKPGKNFEKIAKSAGERYGSKAAGERVAGAVLNKLRGKNESVEEGAYSQDAMALNPDFKKVGQKPGVMNKIARGVKKVADFVAPGDEDLLRDLERKTSGRRPAKEAAAPMTAKQKSFAKLAPPEDKITFADKIAGAKKEVDEMLGDVAAEAMKAALGKGKQATMGEATKEIPGGRRHTSEPGGYGRRDDEEAPKVQTQRGRGRPKKNADSETGEVMKPDWSAFGVGKVNLPKHKGAVTKHKMVGEEVSDDDREVLERLMDEAFADGKNALGNAIQGVLEMLEDENQYDDDEQVNEKAVSKKQQKFMGMVHAAQKGEKPASKEVAKVAKEMPKKEATKFASTKHKGLPDKVKEEDTDTRDTRAEKAGKKVTKDIEYDEKAKDGDHGKKRGPQDAKAEKAGKRVAKDIEHDEKVDENTTSGSVATAPAAGGKKSSGGFNFGGGIYDSMNRDLENMISESMARLDESMNISMNMNSDSQGGPAKSLTITATDDDADKLAMMLKMAGLGSEQSADMAYAEAPDMVDENKPDWPTNTETSDDAFQYSGGLNKPKTDVAGDGQSTGQVTAVSTVDKEEDEELDRMMEMAGVKHNEILDEGVMDKIKGLVPRFMQMVGADTAAEIAKQVKQVTGGDYSLTQDNAVKVAKAFGLDKMQPPGGQGQQQMAEGIAGNWQGKLIQLVYTALAGAGMFAGITGAGGPFAGRFVAVIGALLLLFAHTFWSSDRGMVGAMGRHGNKGFETDKGPESLEEDDLDRMMEMAGVKKAKPDFLDMDKDGDKSEPMKKAVDDKKEQAVKESILDLQNLWTAYKG